MKTLALLFLLAALDPGCLLGGEMPAAFITGRRAPAADLAQWWARFGDRELDRLIAHALGQSPDATAAEARLREARALRHEAAASWWPRVEARGAFIREEFSASGRQPAIVGTGGKSLYQAGFDASWELDLFGRTRNAVQAADAETGAAREARQGVFLSLTAEVADTYLELRGLQERQQVVRENIAAQQETVDLTRDRVRAGLSPALVASQAEALLADTRAALPELEEATRLALYRLAFLCGETPAFTTALARVAATPLGPAAPAAGTPTDLLLRRPDLREAQLRVTAAEARIRAARAERLPVVRVAARVGTETRDDSRLRDRDSLDWNVGPEVRLPLFTGGQITARIREREAARDRERATFEQARLRALSEVEGALVSVRERAARLARFGDAVSASRQALADAQALFKAGGTDFLNVLDTQRALLSAQERTATARADAARAKVRLFKALGGGW